MIHIITRHNSQMYSDIIDQMHLLRHEVFVDGKGWKKLRGENDYEIDQFDTDEAVYFLKLDAKDKILGGMRLLPTTVPTQLGTIFRDYCEFEEPPSDPTVWEWSRYFIVDKQYRSRAGYPVFYELFFSILEYAVFNGISALTGFLEASTLPRLNALPWEISYMGNIHNYGGTDGEPAGKGAAVRVSVDSRMLRITKRMKKMAAAYCALPLGDLSPAPHMAYPPEVSLKFLDFLAKHPEQTDALLHVANIFCDQRAGTREYTRNAVAEWLREEHQKEAMRGFSGLVSSGLVSGQASFVKQ